MTPAELARQRHAGQRRKGTDVPYVVHPEGVASMLARHYPGRPELEAAGWLHDTLEDTATSADELEQLFGPEVRRLVQAVTKGWRQLFGPPRDPDALRLKAADVLDNVRFTMDGLRRGEDVWIRFRVGRRKVEHWRSVAVAAERRIAAEPLTAELRAAIVELEGMVAAETGEHRRAS